MLDLNNQGIYPAIGGYYGHCKIFINGRSLAVRLPRKYRFKADQVIIFKRGDEVVLKKKETSWDDFIAGPSVFGKDYLSTR